MKTRNFTKISIFFLAVIIALNFGLFPKAKAAEIKLYYSDFEKSYTQYQAYYYADKFYNTFGDPSHSYANIYYSYMESDAELQNSIYNWELLHMAANPLQTITGEQWISMQDLYKLAIFDVLNVNYSKPGIFDIVSLNASDYVVGLTDVLTDSAMDQNMLAQMAVNSENLSDLKLALEANYMLEAASFLNNIAKGADNMLEAVTDCASYQAIAETDVHTIAILQAISNDSNNPVELRAAAQECIQYAALDRQAILNMVTADATVDSIRDLVLDAMWDKIASSIPVIGYANIALKGIIVISDAFFNLDKTYESYYYLKVTVELENALRRQMLSYQNDFLQNEDGVRAMRYLRVIDLFERVVLDGFDRSKELLQTQLSAPWYLIRDWFAAPDDESAIAACKAEIEAIDTYKNTKIDNFNKFYELSYQSYLNDYGPVVSWDISSDGSGRIGASLYQLSTGGYKLVISGSGTMQNFEGWTNVPWYSYCSNIDQIKIKSGITSIGDYAFYSCSDLSQITIPEGIVSIGQKAFGACESMMTFTVPASVNSISADAFDGCSRLTEIRVHESNATFSSDEYGVLFNKNKTTLIRCPEYFVGQYQIPDSVVTIGRYAFSDCDGLKDVCVPESVVTCGYFAFYSCDGLLSATVETKLFSYMFRMCPNLKSLYLTSQDVEIQQYAVRGCESLESISFLNKLSTFECHDDGFIVWDDVGAKPSVSSICVVDLESWMTITCSAQYDYACFSINSWFTDQWSLYIDEELVEDYVIPDGVTTIASNMFANYKKLTSITIPDSVTSFGSAAFYNCTGLTSVTIPDSVTSIGRNVFAHCTGLTSVTIPNSVTNISDDAFAHCTGLISVTIPDSVTSIGDHAFWKCTGLTSVAIPDSVTSIGEYAFHDCTGLTSVTIPDSVTSIGREAFEGCTGLASVTIGSGVTSIGYRAFGGCTGLTSVAIPDSVTSIGSYAFPNINVWVDEDNKAYSSDSYGCLFNKEKTAIIQATNNLSGNYVIPDSVTSIKGSAFSGCTGLTSVTIPDSVTSIGQSAFWGCAGLKSVTIPDSVVNIGDYAFKNCTGLKEIIYTGSAPSIGASVFTNVIATAYYPINETSWTEAICQNYDGTITWVPYDAMVAVSGAGTYMSFAEAVDNCTTGRYLELKSDAFVDIVLAKDIYIDLNGFDFSGTITTNGFKIYGMDRTTDNYTCDAIGYFDCVDENGNVIVPVTNFKSDLTGSTKRYMAIKTDEGYSFHRFYIGITHQSLKPTTTGVGYKAVFHGDTMVAANLDSFGFTMTLGDYTPKTFTKTADSFVSGKVISLRIDNFDVENYGEANLYASVMMKLTDGTVIETEQCSMTMRSLLEALNSDYKRLTAEQLTVVSELIEKYAVIQSWKIENLFTI